MTWASDVAPCCRIPTRRRRRFNSRRGTLILIPGGATTGHQSQRLSRPKADRGGSSSTGEGPAGGIAGTPRSDRTASRHNASFRPDGNGREDALLVATDATVHRLERVRRLKRGSLISDASRGRLTAQTIADPAHRYHPYESPRARSRQGWAPWARSLSLWRSTKSTTALPGSG
jgi:hypothetical protein